MIRIAVFAFIFYAALAFVLTGSGLVTGIEEPTALVIAEVEEDPNAVTGFLKGIPGVGNFVGAAESAGQAFAFAIEMAGALFKLFTFQIPDMPPLLTTFLMVPLGMAGAFIVIGVIRGISPT